MMHGTEVEVARIPDCDVCPTIGRPQTPAVVDGRTTVGGRWANMCDACFAEFGVGLGVGQGQRLILRT